LLAPLSTALLFVRPSLPALCFALAALSAFLAHEPLLVLLGRRGARLRAELGERAKLRLAVLCTLGAALLALGLSRAPASVLVTWALPLALCGLAAVAVLLNQERALWAQVLIAAALTSFALPVLAASGVRPELALALCGLWSAIHLMATLTARAVVYRRRVGEHLLGWATATSVGVLATTALLYGAAKLPLAWSLAPAPLALVTFLLAFGLFTPRTPKPLGYALMTASIVAFVLFGVGFVDPLTL
jgi:hypothetical protein